MPDLWAELQRDVQLLLGAGPGEANENTPFTSEEQKDLERRLREVETRVRDPYSLSERQIEILHNKVDYLVGVAGRSVRIDWRNILVGVLCSYIVAVALPSEFAHPFMIHFFHAIRHLFEHGPPDLPLGG
jgi:hypothetical protein